MGHLPHFIQRTYLLWKQIQFHCPVLLVMKLSDEFEVIPPHPWIPEDVAVAVF